jgi:soluble lytic murein transglycosylase-like protein
VTKKQSAKAKLDRLIAKHARENGVPLKLAHAVITIESQYNARARGRAGEVGLMQIKPRTARGIGYKGTTKALYDPDTNLRWGMKYLGEAHRRGGGTVCGTVLKYNAGHYAKRMNKVSANYCGKVKRVLARA